MNREELEALVEPHREALTRFVSMMVVSEAEDIVQEAISTAFRNAEKFQGRSKFSTWLYGIALNLCRKYRRDRGRRAFTAPSGLLEKQPERRRSVLSSVIRHEAAGRLECAVERLPATLREAFFLHYVDGMDYSEISLIIGVSEGTVRIRAFRARTLLREKLGNVVDTIWKT